MPNALRRVRTVLPAIVVTWLVASALSAQTTRRSGNPSERPVEFLQRLKQAVDAADRRTVSAMVAYPLTVLASGFNIPVKDPAAFVRLYDSVFTPELRCAVAALEAPTASSSLSRRAVTVTADGLSMAEGAIWAPLKDGRYRIGRIRVLPPAPSVEGRRGVEHVTFADVKGERAVTFAGWLVRQNVDAFVVALKKGETIEARIEGFRGHDASLRLSTPGAQNPGPGAVADIGRFASAVAPADQEFRIDVAHLAAYCDPPQRYKLTITVH